MASAWRNPSFTSQRSAAPERAVDALAAAKVRGGWRAWAGRLGDRHQKLDTLASRYYCDAVLMQVVPIRSFACKPTKAFWDGENPPKFAAIAKQADKKLAQLDAAASLSDLKVPPGNNLEALTQEKKWLGYHSIRVNIQWRLCFRWTEAGPEDVQIVDYH